MQREVGSSRIDGLAGYYSPGWDADAAGKKRFYQRKVAWLGLHFRLQGQVGAGYSSTELCRPDGSQQQPAIPQTKNDQLTGADGRPRLAPAVALAVVGGLPEDVESAVALVPHH